MEYPYQQVPSLGEASKLLKEGMEKYQSQANQIMAVVACVKRAKTDNYDAYVGLATQLDVEPVSEEQWAAHDKGALRPLIAASLAKNLPGSKCSVEEIDAMLSAAQEKNRTKAIANIMKVLLKSISVPDEDIQGWIKLATNAMGIIF